MKCWWCIPLFILLLLSAMPVAADGPYCETARLTSTALEFGRSVDISGDLAIVGAYSRDRAASIYRREAGGEWVFEATLSIDEYASSWGNAVGISGDTAVVGNPSLGFRGGCTVFRRIAPGDWQLEQKIITSGADVYDTGRYAAIDGDRIILGSRPDPDGAVFIFQRDGTVWSEATKFIGQGSYYYFSSFGQAVDIDGDTAVVGEPSYGNSYYSDPYGAGWVIRHNGGSWGLTGPETGPYPHNDRYLGYDVAVDDDQIVFGTNGGKLDGHPADSGYIIFQNDTTSYSFTPEQSYYNQHFGRRVAISGDRLLASSVHGIYFFDRDVTGNSWIEVGVILFSAPSYHGEIAIDGDTLIYGDSSSGEVRIYEFDSEYCPIVDANISCWPPLGSYPVNWEFSVSIFNLSQTFHRRFSQQIDITIGNGRFYSNWKRSWDNYQPGSRRDYAWNTDIPELGTLIGDNYFTLKVADTTPAPFNQPPYPPAGETASDSCSLTLIERTVGAISLTCSPVSGTLPIVVQGTLDVANLSNYNRTINVEIVRTSPSGYKKSIAQGNVNVGPHVVYSSMWSNTIPDSSQYLGLNTYSLYVQDVTPPPWNQPPYPPAISEHSLENACTVTGYAE